MAKKAGFHAGTVFGKNVKASDRHVYNKLVLNKSDFRLGTGIGISGVYTGVNVTLSGADVFGWTTDETGKAVTTIMTPDGLPSDTKAQVNVYWASSGVTSSNIAVVLDLDYRSVSVQASGVSITGVNYVTSGVVSNVTATHIIITPSTGTTLQKTTLTIPDTDVEGSSFILLHLYRDTGESADTFIYPIQVVAVEVEFVNG